jgi:micrococcal nuclease
MNWKKILIGVLLVVCFAAAVLVITGPYRLEEVTFSYAIDGDTIIVKRGEKEITVRLIGIDTPESTACDVKECTDEGAEAAKFTKEYFKAGQTLYLEYDKQRYDKYGRTLAYVWLKDSVNTDKFSDFRQYCYNAIVLENTKCTTIYIYPNGKHKTWFEDIEVLKNTKQ